MAARPPQLASLPSGADDARWPSDDHEGFRHADAFADEAEAASVADAIAADAGLDAGPARSLTVRARLLAVLFREPERDGAGNLLGVRVATEPWSGAQAVWSELLAIDHTPTGVRALRWEWSEEFGAEREPVRWLSVAAVTLHANAVSGMYLADREWTARDVWAAHEERCGLYAISEVPYRRLVATDGLDAYLGELTALYLSMQATPGAPRELPGPQPANASLRDALWSPRRLGGR